MNRHPNDGDQETGGNLRTVGRDRHGRRVDGRRRTRAARLVPFPPVVIAAALTAPVCVPTVPTARQYPPANPDLLPYPGGTPYREAGPADLIAALPAMLANPIIGLVKHPARADAPPLHMTAPTADPQETQADIRAAVPSRGSRQRAGMNHVKP
ncbi:hypothetical protein ACFYSC_31285 [Streptosporangium sp. NPDC004379]|uniref:hypothetical protein n=1 Tax=Streptosporangium sp. NPDC004379 TaxID=3366189 RepID=UPI00367FBB46